MQAMQIEPVVRRRRLVPSRVPDKVTSFLFLAPYLLMFLLFMLIPLVWGLMVSLRKWDLVSGKHEFIWFQNYLALFNKESLPFEMFWQGLAKTLEFVIYSVPALVIVGLLLALLVDNLPAGAKGFFRTIYFLPTIISVTVIAIIWLWLLDSSGGLVNHYLGRLGIMPVMWLTSQPWAWISLALATLWWTVGFNMVIFLAALAEVPEELIDAAKIDGAGSWARFRQIVIPQIKPVMLFVFITTTIASFNIFGQPFLMTRGGPGVDTKVLLMHIYDEAFTNMQLGSASAMAIGMAFIMVIFSVAQFFLTNRKGGR